ncbi:RNA polymerase II transcription mediator complex subunit 9-domain-containing protein [Nemania sp. FL0916]|nr:RNA polymerase II transcription mediator complex subunit 9-domain-containing protein [Nemania sp. FL0916]
MALTSTQPTPPLALPESLNPDALDVLSELAHLLTRLRTLPPSSSSTNNNANNATTLAGAGRSATATPTPMPTPTPAPNTLSLGTTGAPSSRGGRTGELSLKEIPTATDALKHRFQRARTLVRTALPDLDRGVGDQEDEIRSLERRIERQRETLVRLREVGGKLLLGEGERMEE